MIKHVEELNSEDFRGFVKGGLAIVDFWAEWCGPCKVMSPIFENFAKESKEIKFGKVNVDEEGELAQNFGVMSIPTLIFFKNGEPVDRVTGVIDKEELVKRTKAIKKR